MQRFQNYQCHLSPEGKSYGFVAGWSLFSERSKVTPSTVCLQVNVMKSTPCQTYCHDCILVFGCSYLKGSDSFYLFFLWFMILIYISSFLPSVWTFSCSLALVFRSGLFFPHFYVSVSLFSPAIFSLQCVIISTCVSHHLFPSPIVFSVCIRDHLYRLCLTFFRFCSLFKCPHPHISWKLCSTYTGQ